MCAGCLDDVNCPRDYQCLSGVCRSSPGKVLVQSINIKTEKCKDCSGAGAGLRLSLRGEFIGQSTQLVEQLEIDKVRWGGCTVIMEKVELPTLFFFLCVGIKM